MNSAKLSAVEWVIAGALVTTAIGLFAAILAVIACKRITLPVNRVAVRFESLLEAFANIVQRQMR